MTGGAPSEARRRALHFASGSLGLAALFLRNPHPMLTIVLVSLLAVAVLLEVARRYSPALETALERLSCGAMRPAEHSRVTGSTFLLAGFCLAWVLFSDHAAGVAMLVTATADPAAAMVGTAVSRSRGRKTLAGSAAALLVALAILLLCGTGVLLALGAAATAALAERLPANGLDNVAIPIATAAVLWSLA